MSPSALLPASFSPTGLQKTSWHPPLKSGGPLNRPKVFELEGGLMGPLAPDERPSSSDGRHVSWNGVEGTPFVFLGLLGSQKKHHLVGVPQ